MSLKRKDLLSLAPLSVDEITLVLETADSFKEVTGREIKKVPALRGKTVVNLFFEPSTRTRTSFELAAKRLSADVINFAPSSSSVVKGETLLDTARNIEAMQADIIVLRHSSAGAAETLANGVKSSVINAGDGWHEHPDASVTRPVHDSATGDEFPWIARGDCRRRVAQSRGAFEYLCASQARRRGTSGGTAYDDALWSGEAGSKGLLQHG